MASIQKIRHMWASHSRIGGVRLTGEGFMLAAQELADRIGSLAVGRETLVDFEDWFSVHTRRFHKSEDPALVDFVSAVESVFSRFYFQGLDEDGAKIALRELATAIRPFAATQLESSISVGDVPNPPGAILADEPEVLSSSSVP